MLFIADPNIQYVTCLLQFHTSFLDHYFICFLRFENVNYDSCSCRHFRLILSFYHGNRLFGYYEVKRNRTRMIRWYPLWSIGRMTMEQGDQNSNQNSSDQNPSRTHLTHDQTPPRKLPSNLLYHPCYVRMRGRKQQPPSSLVRVLRVFSSWRMSREFWEKHGKGSVYIKWEIFYAEWWGITLTRLIFSSWNVVMGLIS